ncbi:MAG: hypothetical protein V4850_33405 [Myxococcota bacterium]
MGWTMDGPTVEIHAQGAEGSLQVTSTSTVQLLPAEIGGGAARLRLYGVDEDMVGRAVPAARAWARPGAPSPCGGRGGFISWVDSQLFAPFRFVIDRAAAITATCVPSRRQNVSWPARVSGSLRSLAMNVVYKDPTVLRLPDASWLMVLARYRTLASGTNQPMVGSAAGDVVAWRASDPAFTRDLTGPHWLVDGLQAVPGQTQSAWLGVPGAVVAGTGADLRLDVYYTFHVDAQDGRSYLEAATAGDPRSSTKARPEGPKDQQGVGVKRFRWSDLQAQLSRPAPTEDRWEAAGALSGSLLGRVRVWAASDLPGLARPFDDAFARVKIVDPAPFACTGAADLFFAAIPSGGPGAPRTALDAHGIWHASALPTGALVCSGADPTRPCTVTPAVEGLDFIVAPGGVASRSRLAATAPGALYLDPDPVRLPLGGLRVAAGNVEKGGGLTSLSSAASAVCQPWGTAWQR